MALTTAVGLGAVAAVAVPWIAERSGSELADWLGGELVAIPVGGVALHWSWPIFCLVTLLAWGSLAAARNK